MQQYMQPTGGHSWGEISATDLSFYEAGTYQPQFRRAIGVNVNTEHMLAYDEASQGGKKLNEGAINRLASEVVQLNPTVEKSAITSDGSVFIDNGWGENRARFVLALAKELTPNSRKLYYYIGWTDHLGWVDRGTRDTVVDPNMRLFLNQVIVLHENTLMVGGAPVKRCAIERSDVLLNGYFQPQASIGVNDLAMRPIEILEQLGATNIMNHANMGQGSVFPTHCTFHNRVKHSTHANSSPASWLSRILTSHVSYTTDLEDGRYDRSALHHDAGSKASEITLNEEPLLQLLGTETIRDHGFFTHRQLEQIFPTIDHVTTCHEHEGIGALGRSDMSLYAPTSGASLETQLGSMLQNALPSIASGSLLRFVNFRYTNNNAMMQDNLSLVPMPLLPGETVARPPISSMANGVSVEMMWELFQRKFIAEVVPAITMQRTQIVDVFVRLSIVGDIQMTISIDGRAAVDDRRPCFCGNLTSSLMTNNAKQLVDYATAISNLVNAAESSRVMREIGQGVDPWAMQVHTPGISQASPQYQQQQTMAPPPPSNRGGYSGGIPKPSSMSGGIPKPSSHQSGPTIPRPSNI